MKETSTGGSRGREEEEERCLGVTVRRGKYESGISLESGIFGFSAARPPSVRAGSACPARAGAFRFCFVRLRRAQRNEGAGRNIKKWSPVTSGAAAEKERIRSLPLRSGPA